MSNEIHVFLDFDNTLTREHLHNRMPGWNAAVKRAQEGKSCPNGVSEPVKALFTSIQESKLSDKEMRQKFAAHVKQEIPPVFTPKGLEEFRTTIAQAQTQGGRVVIVTSSMFPEWILFYLREVYKLPDDVLNNMAIVCGGGGEEAPDGNKLFKDKMQHLKAALLWTKATNPSELTRQDPRKIATVMPPEQTLSGITTPIIWAKPAPQGDQPDPYPVELDEFRNVIFVDDEPKNTQIPEESGKFGDVILDKNKQGEFLPTVTKFVTPVVAEHKKPPTASEIVPPPPTMETSSAADLAAQREQPAMPEIKDSPSSQETILPSETEDSRRAFRRFLDHVLMAAITNKGFGTLTPYDKVIFPPNTPTAWIEAGRPLYEFALHTNNNEAIAEKFLTLALETPNTTNLTKPPEESEQTPPPPVVTTATSDPVPTTPPLTSAGSPTLFSQPKARATAIISGTIIGTAGFATLATATYELLKLQPTVTLQKSLFAGGGAAALVGILLVGFALSASKSKPSALPAQSPSTATQTKSS